MNEEQVIKTIQDRFQANGIKIDKIENKYIYLFKYKGYDLNVNIENTIKECKSTNSLASVDELFKPILAIGSDITQIDNLNGKIYPVVEYEFENIDKLIRNPIDKSLYLYYVIYDGSLRFISNDELDKINLKTDEIIKIAAQNLSSLFHSTKIESEDLDGHQLYYFNTQSPLKATLLFSDAFQDKYNNDIVYMVLPVRDFCYFFFEKDKDYFFKKIGSTVQEEYSKSDHPITKEVVMLKQGKYKIIGTF
jgi:uncharacterized protein YtpQ (UPF0354 family)